MNRKTIFTLSALLLTAALLAGCQEETAPAVVQKTPDKTVVADTPVVPVAPVQDVQDMMPAGFPELPAGTVAKTYSETDKTAFNSAQQLKDPSFCDKISEVAFQQECKISLVDLIALNEAISKMDASICSKISNEDKIGACKIQIEAINKEQQNRQEILKAQAETQKLANSINLSADPSRCKELPEQNIVNCEIQILGNKAVQEKNAAICELASSQEAVDGCKRIYTNLAEIPE